MIGIDRSAGRILDDAEIVVKTASKQGSFRGKSDRRGIGAALLAEMKGKPG
jgi:hypothetical protein